MIYNDKDHILESITLLKQKFETMQCKNNTKTKVTTKNINPYRIQIGIAQPPQSRATQNQF